MIATVKDFINGVSLNKVDAIRWGKPIATTKAYHEVFDGTEHEKDPSLAELNTLQGAFDYIVEKASILQINLVCVAFGNKEKDFTGEDLCTSYFMYTSANIIGYDYGELILEIRSLYEQLASGLF